jgi:site-specific recombinase XerC
MTDGQKTELRQWQSDHHWCPNRLRHTAATEIRSKFGLEAAQIILGHAQANVTQVYAERDIAKGIEVATCQRWHSARARTDVARRHLIDLNELEMTGNI